MIEPAVIESKLKAAFPDGHIRIVDLTGTRDHYEAVVVSSAFEGRGLIEQHRLVYGALGDAVGTSIHALALKTYTPAAWARVQSP
jgi:stress-induced morphogen